jgi:hypothetical protein
MKTTALLVLCAPLLLSSCEKFSGPTEVSGIVVDRHTGQPVAGAHVVAVGASSSWAGGSSLSAGTLADAQGNQGNGPLLRVGYRNDNLLVNADAPAWVRIRCVDDPPYGKAGLFVDGYLNGGESKVVGPGDLAFVRPTFSYRVDSVIWELSDAQGQLTRGRLPYRTTGFDTATVTVHF